VVNLNRRFVRSFRRTTPSAPVLALINTGLLAFADVLFNPFLLSALIFLLGGETWKIATPLVISGASWSLSVPIRAVMSRVSPPGRYLATASGVIRTAAAVLIAWLGYFADDVERARLIDLLLMCYAAYLIASAFNLATIRGLIAASTPAIRAPALFRLQRILAGASSVAGGIVAIYALRSNELEFYKNVGVLFLLGAVAVAAATWFQFMTTVAATRATVPVSGPRGGIWNALTNPAVRRLLGFRFLIGLSALADPFLIVFGIQELGFDIFYIAAAIATFAGGQLLSALVAPRWSEHRGPRGILLTSAVFRLVAIVLALALPSLSRTTLYTDRFDTNWQATLAFAGLFALLGISAYLQGIGSQRYISDVVPAGGRVATISLANVILAVTAASPLLGAYLIEQYDLETLLIVSTVLAFVGFASGGLLFDPSPRQIRQQGTWRQRRTVRRAA
jgi:hypothetical protein